jgi:hypothetical protein
MYNQGVLVKGVAAKRVAPRTVLRFGSWTIAAGVAMDAPPHLLPHMPLETLALVGHLVVLGGMVIVLLGLIAAAIAVPRSNARRLP